MKNQRTNRKGGSYILDFFSDDNEFIGHCYVNRNYLYNVFIMEQFRRHGWCKKIVLYTIKEMKKDGQKEVKLKVLITNDAAKNCYKSCGFETRKKGMKYYYMEKKL